MILFVDYEHERGRSQPWGEKVQAARTWITYRLEDIAGMPCHLVRYDKVDTSLIDRLGAQAMFISGNGTDPRYYEPAAVGGLHGVIRNALIPTFGFCGGFQCMAQALGAELTPIEVDSDTPPELLMPFGKDRMGEAGYHPVELVADHPMLEGLDAQPVMRHAHYLQVPAPPDGFRRLASTTITPVQMAVDDERRMVGTQFHPEYYTDEHPGGRTLIENFLRWTGLTPEKR